MATKAYHAWVSAGRPWKLAQPIAELEAWARANGFNVLGTIGNEEHLQASTPQDHTPFSATAHPVPLPAYVVCAIDLADERALGAALLAGARAGRFPWLKYINAGGKHYGYRDGFQSSTPNSDRHNHLSILTTWIARSIGDFNPFGDIDMDENDRRLAGNVERILTTWAEGKDPFGVDYGDGIGRTSTNPFRQIKEQIAALQLGGIDPEALAEAMKPHLEAAAKAGAEAAVRKVLGAVDGASPQVS